MNVNLFLAAARKKYRFAAANGALTTEQLFDLPLTSTTGKANLNDVALRIADELDKTGTRSFVASASQTTAHAELSERLEIVKAVIDIKQTENAAAVAKQNKRAERDRLLDAIDAADRRELGSKSSDELRKQLAAMDD